MTPHAIGAAVGDAAGSVIDPQLAEVASMATRGRRVSGGSGGGRSTRRLTITTRETQKNIREIDELVASCPEFGRMERWLKSVAEGVSIVQKTSKIGEKRTFTSLAELFASGLGGAGLCRLHTRQKRATVGWFCQNHPEVADLSLAAGVRLAMIGLARTAGQSKSRLSVPRPAPAPAPPAVQREEAIEDATAVDQSDFGWPDEGHLEEWF